MVYINDTCKFCKINFPTKVNSKKEFCSVKCKYNFYQKEKLKKRIKFQKCLICNKIFNTVQPRRIYCEKCRPNKEVKGKCIICKRVNNIHKHHIVMQINGGEKTVDLCSKCHRNIHKFYSFIRKKGYDIKKTNKNLPNIKIILK